MLADAYRLSRSERAALLELTELAGMRSLADEMAWVTAHVFPKTTATILEDSGQRRGGLPTSSDTPGRRPRSMTTSGGGHGIRRRQATWKTR